MDRCPSAAAPTGAPTPRGRPLLLADEGRREEARAALREVPDPPRDLMAEVLWCLVARVAVAVDDRASMLRARTRLLATAGEGTAGSGLVTLGPVADHLESLSAALEGDRSRWPGPG